MATPFRGGPKLSLSHMRVVSEFPFLLNLCFIFVGYFGWVQGLQNGSDFFAVNFPVPSSMFLFNGILI
jgi:hypothetical protein